MENKIKITFKKEDVEKCGDYSDNYNCLLATALKRMRHIKPMVLGGSFYTDAKYVLTRKAKDMLAGDNYPNFAGRTIVATLSERPEQE
jgi:hypothetical protein